MHSMETPDRRVSIEEVGIKSDGHGALCSKTHGIVDIQMLLVEVDHFRKLSWDQRIEQFLFKFITSTRVMWS